MANLIQLKDKNDNKLFALSTSARKLDYANQVDISALTSYEVPNDGVLLTNSGDVSVNKGTTVKNNGETVIYVPYRYSAILPSETTASDIPCNNGTSNVQAELNSLNDNKWKYLGSANTTNALTLPSVWNELLIYAWYPSIQSFQFNFLKQEFTNANANSLLLISGQSYSATEGSFVQVNVTTTTVKCAVFRANYVNLTSGFGIRVYYR